MSTRGEIPPPWSRDRDLEVAVGVARRDVDRAAPVGIGVDDRVGARLGDRQRDVGDHVVWDVEAREEAPNRMADERNARGGRCDLDLNAFRDRLHPGKIPGRALEGTITPAR